MLLALLWVTCDPVSSVEMDELLMCAHEIYNVNLMSVNLKRMAQA